ncbi:MAG: HNH endonuclease [Blastocatellales bacterium]
MKYIPLINSHKKTIIDDWRYNALAKYRWRLYARGRKEYVIRYTSVRSPNSKWRKGIRVWMHRVIARTPRGLSTDHINGDTLDNKEKNLRVVTIAQNNMNRKIGVNNTSGYKGVTWVGFRRVWRAKIKKDGKTYHLGYYKSISKAARAYRSAAREMFGEYANV